MHNVGGYPAGALANSAGDSNVIMEFCDFVHNVDRGSINKIDIDGNSSASIVSAHAFSVVLGNGSVTIDSTNFTANGAVTNAAPHNSPPFPATGSALAFACEPQLNIFMSNASMGSAPLSGCSLALNSVIAEGNVNASTAVLLVAGEQRLNGKGYSQGFD